SQRIGQRDPKSAFDEIDDIPRPANTDSRRTYRVLQDQVPADNPGDQLTKRRVRVGIGAAGNWYGTGEFGIADGGESTHDASYHERKYESRPCVFCCRDSG